MSYNKNQIASGSIQERHLVALTEAYQRAADGLAADGMCGPKTRQHIDAARVRAEHPLHHITVPGLISAQPELEIDNEGWLRGAGVAIMAMHPSWRYSSPMKTEDGFPEAVIMHYTATNPGTAINMARRRMVARVPEDRSASWQISVETDGSIIQMADIRRRCWHAGGSHSKNIPGLGHPNNYAVGIEIVGHGGSFPEPQVMGVARVLRAIVERCDVESRLILGHSDVNDHKSDPGPVWAKNHAMRVIEYAYRRIA